MRNFISIKELSKEEVIEVLDVAKELDNTDSRERRKLMDGMIMTSIFFEPSTRTRLSFTSAAYRLGCKELGFDNPEQSSVKKGESLRDTIIMVSAYSDIIVMRHSIDGAAKFAEEVTNCPIINAGDGANEHPSQTLLDLYTLREELGTIENKKLAFVGDTRYGRTVHSLVDGLMMFNGEFYFISPDVIQIPDYILKELDNANIKYKKLSNYEEVLKEIDCLYMTRVQKERFDDINEYEEVKHAFRISKDDIIGKCKEDMIILHPLPRLDEINIDLDDTKYAKYFIQARNGVPTRMAMMALATDVIKSKAKRKEMNYEIVENKEIVCPNHKCVTHFEETKNRVVKKGYGDFCYYCNREIGK
ncbi:aspartate carbamoyltransferase [Brachyspira intermedia]|uniref:aspartate carbamoyltransferase n=1 Tax=Brachyspira intermedia TaxID=84377 RepID=UPI0030044390